MKRPILSIVTPTYNASTQLDRYFRSIEIQTVSPNKYEILIIDGGSTDDTIAIAKKHHATIVHNPKKLAEPGVALGFEKAKGEFIMILATDNIFVEANAFEKILSVFSNSDISSVFPKHDSEKADTIFSRYVNTFTDPFTHFVYQNAANARTFYKIYPMILHTDLYDLYDYKKGNSYPLIALAQGFTIRKKDMPKRYEEKHDDVLTVYSLIDQGKTIAYAHGISMYHYTIGGFSDFVRKTKRAVENAMVRANSGISKRNHYLTPRQQIMQYLFFPYSFSIIAPLTVSLYNVLISGNSVWLFHTPISWISALILAITAIHIKLKKII